MNEQDIQVFIDGIKNYFSTFTQESAQVGSPFLVSHVDVPCHDYTGIIGISGERKGCVYFTTPRILLRYLLMSLGEKDIDDQLLRDIVGEVANTISANARESFGDGFLISVPLVIQGHPEKLQLPKNNNSFVIPIQWHNYSGALVVCIE